MMRAVGGRAAAALIDDRGELATQGTKVGNFSFNRGQVLTRNGVHRNAGAVALVR
jgi:hypothetical protein